MQVKWIRLKSLFDINSKDVHYKQRVNVKIYNPFYSVLHGSGLSPIANVGSVIYCVRKISKTRENKMMVLTRNMCELSSKITSRTESMIT